MRTSVAMVYVLVDPRTDCARYVGWTTNPERRLAAHLKEAAAGGRSHKCNWIRQLSRLGLSPHLRILAEVPRARARSEEVIAARRLREGGARLTNGGPGGDLEPWGWNRGLTKDSDKRVARAADALRARMLGNQHWRGRTHSPAAREKVRVAQLKSLAEHPERRTVWSRHRHPSLGKPGWAAGLTKETDDRVALRGRNSGLARRGLVAWNKGKRSA